MFLRSALLMLRKGLSSSLDQVELKRNRLELDSERRILEPHRGQLCVPHLELVLEGRDLLAKRLYRLRLHLNHS